MTLLTQPMDLSPREISALRLLAVDARATIDKQLEDDLFAKGLLQSTWDRCLSPAGRNAIHVGPLHVPRQLFG